MFNHAAADHVCPFCRLVGGGEDEHRKQHDTGDDLYLTRPEADFAPAGRRLPYADKLRDHFDRECVKRG